MKYMIQYYQNSVTTVTEVFDQSYSIENGIRGYKGVGKEAVRLLRVIVPDGVSRKRGRRMELENPGMVVEFMEDKELKLMALLLGGTV